MRPLLLTIALVLVASAAVGGEVGFASGESCTVSADTVSCGNAPQRGSLVIESSIDSFTKLRDALTPDWDGNMTCSACDVAAAFPGCSAEGDVVATTRKKAALARLSCILRSHVVQGDRRSAVAAAEAGVDPDPDIGGGDPG